MRNREEFEEYVRGLADKKLAEKQKKHTGIRRLSFGIGGCAAAVICAVLIVYINSELGIFGRKDGTSDLNGAPSAEQELWASGNNIKGDSAEAVTDSQPAQDGDYTEEEKSYAGMPEGFKEYGITDSESVPEYVNVRRENADFKLEEKEHIRRLVKTLNSFELTYENDQSCGNEFLMLDFVYSDKTVTFGFAKSSISVSGKGVFSVPPERVSELSDLVDSLIQSEQ